MNLIAQIEAARDVVDHAAQASDRWLFLAALAIIIAGGSLAIRWLVTSLTAKDAVHIAERKELIAEIRAEHLECRAARKEDQAAFLHTLELKDQGLAANTRAIEALTLAISRRDHGV